MAPLSAGEAGRVPEGSVGRDSGRLRWSRGRGLRAVMDADSLRRGWSVGGSDLRQRNLAGPGAVDADSRLRLERRLRGVRVDAAFAVDGDAEHDFRFRALRRRRALGGLR